MLVDKNLLFPVKIQLPQAFGSNLQIQKLPGWRLVFVVFYEITQIANDKRIRKVEIRNA